MISSNYKIVEKVVGVCQGILDNFSFDHFIDGSKVIDFANRCALRKICRLIRASGAGRCMVPCDFQHHFLYFVVFVV